MEITILSGAEIDLFEAWREYEEWVPGLGDRFDEAFREATARLLVHPHSAPRFAGPFRRMLVHDFEHGIFYQVHGRRIVISAVLLLRQDPDAILRRLGL